MAPSFVSLFILLLSVLKVTNSEFFFSPTHRQYSKDPSTYYSMIEMVCSEGYSVQEHKITTDDGYILTLYRIPSGKRRPKVLRSSRHYRYVHKGYHPDFERCARDSRNETGGGMPVLFVHGVLMASDGWILQGAGRDMAYLLADAGYDVWLVNLRGNFYSKKHKYLTTKDPKFWDYSFHEHAYYDVPATIDYILKLTKYKKLFYVGFSMGTSTFFAMASSRPEYNNKIVAFIALAPVVYNKYENASPERRILFKSLFRLAYEGKKENLNELFPRSSWTTNLISSYCSKGSPFQNFCYDVSVPVFGYYSKLFLKNRFHIFLGHVPAGTSFKTIMHFTQCFQNNRFSWYDYGRDKNMLLYGAPEPPYYPLRKITAPVALYYTEHDFFYDKKDVEILKKVLPNVIDSKLLTKFNHVDYIIAYNAKELVYDRAVALMNKVRRDYYLSRANEI